MDIKGDLKSLKEQLMNIEKHFSGKISEVEDKESKFQKLEKQVDDYVASKDQVIILNIGGKMFKTRISTLLNVKDTLFYQIITSYVEKNEETPKILFFDRGYTHFKAILEYLRTKKFSIKQFNRYEREEVIEELEYYGMADILGVNKKISIDVGWDSNLSKSGACTVDSSDNRIIRVHSNTCYTHFVTNRTFESENVQIELDARVAQSDNYFYIGVVNENYNYSSNCMCCNPPNAYYIQCDGSIHINSTRTDNVTLAWGSNKVVLGIKLMLIDKQIFFYTQDRQELGPYTIFNGTRFRVVAGHCNTGNGEITILDCWNI